MTTTTETTTTTIETLDRQIAAISAVEHLVATNSGTYGPAEACRKVGTSDPTWADYREYHSVGGRVRYVGCDRDRAPGRVRHLSREGLDADRRVLADLQRQRREMLSRTR